ncbi:MAG: hypothetical protein COU35_04640 [Candidatus Magasanikbacteria bacterium CG10_big_fil_rev_8_21_14_0_10_47_10]|uniref:Bacterial type II secretion system protein E domain-containing protein n=1 Tax=Candidatus Magasanikbacteria bacterium CG10_big_fil_rev_8_21_14_0_10_47_10 TaxID=1974652 RepID=A0A2H0TPK7_9BACT|nr:MAG: hypothetical protein COU35_04640 [Candidatus Magasanikbacteria bacterium CG10_big_fil_rev_8_21_14_0_10_47_10]
MLDDALLQKILIEKAYLSQEDMLQSAQLATQDDVPLQQSLINNNVLTKALLGQAVGEYFGYQYVDLQKQKVDDDIFFQIPESMAVSQQIVAFGKANGTVQVAIVDPTKTEIIDVLEKRFDTSIQVFITLVQDIAYALKRYKKDIKAAYESLLDTISDDTTEDIEADDAVEGLTAHVANLILNNAERNGTSDIHIEPYERKSLVRFRVDGVLSDRLEMDLDMHSRVMTRIKVLSRMRTDEHRAAQDGKFRFVSDAGEAIDVRVSVVPTKYGENVVMRLLSSHGRQFTLTNLGLVGHDLEKVKENIKNPHGMILVTGPTGSGKTTTLYAVMKLLNKRDVNIATIEDPIEYDISGVTQIQVNTKTNLTFAQGLRSIVRQDPDIIMVGEIRDEETAGIGVNSALTGHLVLSTLHTNDAPTSLPRLLDMQVEPFLVASTVNIIIAQRLVRVICASCKASHVITDQEKKILQDNGEREAFLSRIGVSLDNLRLYKGNGCKVCGDTGYAGRIGIFEVMIMDEQMRQLVVNHSDSDSIKAAARQKGMTTMLEDGIRKVLDGVTTLEEVLRVAM